MTQKSPHFHFLFIYSSVESKKKMSVVIDEDVLWPLRVARTFDVADTRLYGAARVAVYYAKNWLIAVIENKTVTCYSMDTGEVLTCVNLSPPYHINVFVTQLIVTRQGTLLVLAGEALWEVDVHSGAMTRSTTLP